VNLAIAVRNKGYERVVPRLQLSLIGLLWYCFRMLSSGLEASLQELGERIRGGFYYL
jgi:hypothetical protein